MNLFKKVLSLLLAILLIFTMAACSGKEDASSNDNSSGSSSDASGPSEDIGGSEDSSKDDTSASSKTPSGSDGDAKEPTGSITETEEPENTVWDGKVASSVAKGGGTEEYPYLIYTAAELAYAMTTGGKDGYCYQLQNDIYLNDVSSKNWMNSKNNNAWVATGDFTGSLDGNGYCIYGVWFDKDNQAKNSGFITNFLGGTVKNLGIRNSFIVAQQYAGGFAARASGSDLKVFENCFVDETVYVQYTTKGNHGAGGIIGYSSGGSGKTSSLDILNCYSKAQVTGLNTKERVNGIIGTSWSCAYTMKNCYSVGLAPYYGNSASQASVMLAAGVKTSQVYSNIYTDARDKVGKESFTKLSTSKMKGSSARSNMKLDFGGVFETVSSGFPKLKMFKGVSGKDISVTDIEKYSYIERDFANGKGTEAEPFVIKTADELRKVVTGSWADTYFVLGNNISVNSISNSMWAVTGKEWETLNKGGFAGNFDGKGYTVSGLCLNATPVTGDIKGTEYVGLFPIATTSAVIKNVHVRDAQITGKTYVGAIVGFIMGGSKSSTAFATVTGCSADSSVYLSGQTVGGIVGGGGGGVDIRDCYFTGTIGEATGSTKGTNRGNGIVGDIWSDNYKMDRCYTVGYPVCRKGYLPKEGFMGTVYSDIQQDGITLLTAEQMKGTAAKTNMPAFDWNKTWKTTSGYPGLR